MSTVLVIGGGGREHALAWRLARSPQVSRVVVAPGNGGTPDRRDGASLEVPALLALARQEQAALTVIGPEAPLAAGAADAFAAAGLRCFGPSRDAARLETSKAFCKDFMTKWSIPTARYAVFSEVEAARAFVRSAPWPLVLKASGLAEGKGVLLPESAGEALEALERLMVAREFGAAGDEIVIEERLVGEEVSLLAFCDGERVAPMLAARDHKRAWDGDRGPNTGGMGAVAPVPWVDEARRAQIVREVLQPAVDGMREEGTPYVGVLYAGIMWTAQGPRTLEFNCRFGDPETQALMPLLEGDLFEIMAACVEGRLDPAAVRWRPGACAAVVVASEGYPGPYPRGRAIHGVEAADALEGVQVFHAGTRQEGDALVTSGGRVLAVTGVGDDLPEALQRAYEGVDRIGFEGCQARRDIGARLGWG